MSYKINFKDEVMPQWDDLVYLIRRHRVAAAKELVKYLPKKNKF